MCLAMVLQVEKGSTTKMLFRGMVGIKVTHQLYRVGYAAGGSWFSRAAGNRVM